MGSGEEKCSLHVNRNVAWPSTQLANRCLFFCFHYFKINIMLVDGGQGVLSGKIIQLGLISRVVFYSDLKCLQNHLELNIVAMNTLI